MKCISTGGISVTVGSFVEIGSVSFFLFKIKVEQYFAYLCILHTGMCATTLCLWIGNCFCTWQQRFL